MTTLVFHHPACSRHDTGAGHPECAARLAAITEALQGPEFAGLLWREAPPATLEQLIRVHPRPHVERLLAAVPERGHRALDADTRLSPDSGEAALRAAGAACAAVDALLAGQGHNAFCLVRPPGHHAEAARAMGFCLFNNLAVAAAHALASGLDRVAIVDFDVHHGNGTQAIFENRAECLYVSSHQWPLYPGTGHRHERGVGNILNLPLDPHSGSSEFRQAWSEQAMPALEAHRPAMLFISAGFDAHRMDPLASLNLTEADYAWITRELLEVAARHAGGRVVSALEGGYDLDALASSCATHLRELMAPGMDAGLSPPP